MANTVLMVGQFPPLITGEAIANSTVYSHLKRQGFSVQSVNSCIIKSVNDVGSISLRKSISALAIIIRFIAKLSKVSTVYITPGQTLPGILRSLPLIAASKLLKKRTIIHWHGYGVLNLYQSHPRLLSFFFDKKATNIILTKDLEQKLKALGANTRKVRVVYNFASLKPPELGNCDQRKVDRLKVLYLGGLMPEKGFLNFLEASKQAPEFEFNVCGSGNEEIINLTKSYDQDGYINYIGLIQGKDKSNILAAADIFVLPTFHPTEGVPLTILEAMASGCAIVTTQHNGIPETVAGSAIFIQKNDTNDLVKNLRLLNNNRELLETLKQKSLARAKAFSEEKFAESISKIFTETF